MLTFGSEIVPQIFQAAVPHGLPGHLTRRRRFAPFAGNDDVEKRSRGAFFAPEFCVLNKETKRSLRDHLPKPI
jgi:hypothetical protein